EDEEAQLFFIERETQILDGISTHLRTLTVDELQDRAGSKRLKLDILMIIENIIKPHGVMAIFFKEFMIR
ncbi:MAG: flagellar basal body-associated FliL family protein, partial [Magnetovibrio sp.]|nr:flagellar basal body-associated FliL family protein [Magnetovibrio sp.]